jgi:glycosyltransferase involved in cell wall biosynthesis
MKLSIIIPAYNEGATIRKVLARVGSVSYPVAHEVLVVDDASTDGTAAALAGPGVAAPDLRVLVNPENAGKGSSVRRGLEHAAGDIAIVQDADLEYDPADIPALVRPIVEGRADAVYGSRFRTRRWPEKMAFPNWAANRILTALANLLYRARLTDVSCGYKAVRTDLLRSLGLECRRFEFCFEVTAKLRRRGVRILEVPISFTARTKKEGKKIGTADFLEAVWTLLKNRF